MCVYNVCAVCVCVNTLLSVQCVYCVYNVCAVHVYNVWSVCYVCMCVVYMYTYCVVCVCRAPGTLKEKEARRGRGRGWGGSQAGGADNDKEGPCGGDREREGSVSLLQFSNTHGGTRDGGPDAPPWPLPRPQRAAAGPSSRWLCGTPVFSVQT